jgi:hypothetical protein
MSVIVHELTKGWSFRQTDSEEEWAPVARVPSNVHLDLLANKRYVRSSSSGYLHLLIHLPQNTRPIPWLQRAQVRMGWRNIMDVSSKASCR